MIDVRNKRCGHPGCTTIPSYGVGGRKKREFCFKHPKGGMVNMNRK